MNDSARQLELIEPKTFGAYVLTRRLAVGGSAEVFLAESQLDPSAKPVVVKRLLPSIRARGEFGILHREAELHRLVDHPNVVKVLQAGAVGDEPYLAMEYVDGLDLHRLLQRSSSSRQAIPPELAAHIARSIADALYAVHTATYPGGEKLGMIHGDVSPSNIYLSMEGDVKLGDFGIARVAAQQRIAEEPERAAGHFGYLAPEQLTGEVQDHRVDVFALGVVLGELLLGARIFPGSGHLAIMLSIRDANIAPLRAAAARFPPGLFEVCERALLRDPEKRYASAREFSEALAPFERPSSARLRQSLGSWVTWAKDNTRFAEELEQRVRESVNMLRAVTRSSSGIQAVSELENSNGSQPELRQSEHSRLRRAGSDAVEVVPFARLLEMVATGELRLSDEVALWGAPFQPVETIEELARHLVPSTTARTTQMYGPGVPDYVAEFSDVPMLKVLAKVHNERRTCSLFVTQSSQHREHRKDVYIREGRLIHVTSTDPDELLGRYLVHQRVLTPAQLEEALGHLAHSKRQLGEVLIGLGMVDAVDVFTALRNQGRDRIAALCGWKKGSVQLYAGAAPERMLFPLDLDLTLCMMAGALRERTEPPSHRRVVPGARAPQPGEKLGCIPLLTMVPMVSRKRTTVQQARAELVELSRHKSEREANAALIVAEALEWIAFEGEPFERR